MTESIPLAFIIPVYCRQEKLNRAIRSILSQPSQPEEVIIVDDASPEPLILPPEFAATGRVRLIRRSVNGGAAQARNTGMRAAQSNWISFLDSDDWLLPNSLGQRWRYLQYEESRALQKGRTVYGCGWQDTLPDGTLVGERTPLPARGPADFVRGCWFSPGSCIILNRLTIMHHAGEVDGTLRRLEDYEWFFRIALAGFELKVQELVGVGIERGSNTSLTAVDAAANVIEQRIADLTKNRPDALSLRRKAKSYLLYEKAASAWRERKFGSFALLIAGSLLISPRFKLSPLPGWTVRNETTQHIRS